MRRKEYNAIIKEHFDLSDMKTLKVLTSLNEAEQNQALAQTAARLYDMIKKKAVKIDYGDIPKSNGNITDIPGFLDIKESISIVNDLIYNACQGGKLRKMFSTIGSPANQLNALIENMRLTGSIWRKGFYLQSELVTFTYVNIAMCIIGSSNLLISACVEFTKNPNNKTFSMAVSEAGLKDTMNSLLFKQVEKLNKAFAENKIQDTMNQLLESRTAAQEAGIDDRSPDYISESIVSEFITKGFSKFGGSVIAASLVVFFTLLIPCLHCIVNFFYCAKQDFSNWLEMQAEVVQLNAEEQRYNYSKTEEERDKIYKRQSKIAEKLKSLANKMEVKMKKADKDAQKETDNDNKDKTKIDDIPGDYGSSDDDIF